MKATKSDVLSPANAISLAGLAVTVAGCLVLTSWPGVAMATLGRALDLLDGPVARRTHTSLLGAKVDATIDKLCILALLIAAVVYSLSPWFVALYILLQNAIVAGIGIAASRRGIHMHSSRAGKNNAFLQSCALLVFAGAARISQPANEFLITSAYAILLISLYYAITATIGYFGATRSKAANLKEG